MATEKTEKKDIAEESKVEVPTVSQVTTTEEPPVAEVVTPPVMTAEESEEPAEVGADLSQPQMVEDMGYTKTSSNKMLYVLVGVLALVLMSLVGLFFFRQMSKTPEKAVITPTPVAEVTVEKPSPSVSPVNDEDAELADIVIEDIDADLKVIETDLGGL
ncbi:MAG: hypothetical protein O3B87_02370 [bacterium]|nr:hypothetical protein [bacterium]